MTSDVVAWGGVILHEGIYVCIASIAKVRKDAYMPSSGMILFLAGNALYPGLVCHSLLRCATCFKIVTPPCSPTQRIRKPSKS
jgi:hypothetical protein